MNWPGELAVPPGVVTFSVTDPVPAGDTAVTSVALTTVKRVAAVVPKATAVAPVRLVPVIVTVVPPAVGPSIGDNPLVAIVGGAA